MVYLFFCHNTTTHGYSLYLQNIYLLTINQSYMMFKKILLIGIGSIAVQNAAFAQQKPVLAPGAPVQTQGVKLHRPNFTKNDK